MIIFDSSFVVACHNTRDVHHAAAQKAMERVIAREWGNVLLPEYVFLEVATVLAARRDLETAVSVGETLFEAREVEFVPCSEFFGSTFEIFRGQARSQLSFADAAIIAIARGRGVEHVATFDSDFRDVGGLTVVPD